MKRDTPIILHYSNTAKKIQIISSRNDFFSVNHIYPWHELEVKTKQNKTNPSNIYRALRNL